MVQLREEGVEKEMVEKELGRGWWRRTRAARLTGCVKGRDERRTEG
jgi:hypothetical protein